MLWQPLKKMFETWKTGAYMRQVGRQKSSSFRVTWLSTGSLCRKKEGPCFAIGFYSLCSSYFSIDHEYEVIGNFRHLDDEFHVSVISDIVSLDTGKWHGSCPSRRVLLLAKTNAEEVNTRIFMHVRKTEWHKQQMLTWEKGRQKGWTLTKKVLVGWKKNCSTTVPSPLTTRHL